MHGKTGVIAPLHATSGSAPEHDLVIIPHQGMAESIAQKQDLRTLNLKYVKLLRPAKVTFK